MIKCDTYIEWIFKNQSKENTKACFTSFWRQTNIKTLWYLGPPYVNLRDLDNFLVAPIVVTLTKVTSDT